MKTKILILFLTLAALMPVAQAQLTYSTNSGAITITGFTGSPASINIPANIGSYPVTSIGANAFRYCSSLINITIPNSIINIDNDAFYACSSLTNIIIPNSVVGIGGSSFAYCSSLANATILNGVASIGDYAFDSCNSLANITIPNSVTSIGDYVFFACGSLTTVVIPNTVTSINFGAFADCTNLANITIPDSVNVLGGSAFENCSKLMNITFAGNVPSLGDANVFADVAAGATVYYYIGTSGWSSTYGGLPTQSLGVLPALSQLKYSTNNGAITITGHIGLLTNINIPATIYGYPVTSISNTAFSFCTSLTNITILNSVTNIGGGAFGYCTSLAGITIPNSVASLGDDAFYGCSSLTNITFQGNAPGLGGGNVFTDVAAGAMVYYYYGTSGWSSTYGGLPTVELGAPSPPQISGVGMPSSVFTFTITGVMNQKVVVEASTNLVNWQSIWTNTLSGTSINFTDPQWKNYSDRFYRAR